MKHQVARGGGSPPVTDESLSELIGSIYDCALDPGRWDETLAQIARAFDSERVILSLNDLGRDRMLISKAVGWEPYWLEQRARHLPEVHAALAAWLAGNPGPETPFIASREVPASARAALRYEQEVLGPLGIGDIAHFFLIRSALLFSELVVAWQRSQGDIGEREIRLGALLGPHLRRALTINDVLDMKSLEQQALGATLDSITIGVVIVGGGARILFANAAARRMLDRGAPVASLRGRLAALQPETTRTLRDAIALAQTDEALIGAAGVGVPLPAEDRAPATAHILPLARGDFRSQLIPHATAAVFIAPATDEVATDVATVARLFGLTAAETRHLQQLLAGATLAEAAAALGVSVATARTHREHIFGKTGVSRRGELAAKVERLVPPVRRPDRTG